MVKKLYIAVISMILLVVTLTTSTFAWVEMAETNRVDGFNMSASTDSNLEFSLDGVNFYNTIKKEQLNILLENVYLEDLTSFDGTTFYSNHSFTEMYAYPNVNYISIILDIRTNTRYTDVYLVNNISKEVNFGYSGVGTYVLSKGITFTSSVEYEFSPSEIRFPGETHLYYAKDAIRVSFTEMTTSSELDTRDDKELNKFIFDPSGDIERGYGKVYGNISYVNATHVYNIQPPTQIPDTIYELTSFDKYNSYQPLDTSSRVARLIDSGMVDENGKKISIGKVMLNVWLEGYDADMFDAIYKDILQIQFEFQSALPIDN